MALLSFFRKTTTETLRQPHPIGSVCTFCEKARSRLSPLVLGPKTSICSECTETVSRLALAMDRSATEQLDLHLWQLADEENPCDFCGRYMPQVWKILRKATKGLICTECLELCNDIICVYGEEQGTESETSQFKYFSSQLKMRNKEHRGGIFLRLRRLLTSRW